MAGVPRDSVAFAMQALDRIHNEAYRRWVIAGITAAAIGYAFVTVSGVVLRGYVPLTFATQATATVACVFGLWLARRGRLELGALIALLAVWLELQSEFPLEGIEARSLLAYPTLVVGAGLLFGGRGGYLCAGVTVISVPILGVWLHRIIGVPTRSLGEDGYLVALLAAILFVTAALVDLAMRALGSTVRAAVSSEEKLSELVRHAPDGIVALGGDGVILSVNPEAEWLLGSAAELVGRTMIEALRPRVVDGDAEALWADLVESGEGIDRVRFEVEDPHGAHRIVEAATTGYMLPDESERFQVTLHDATERVRTEALEREVRSRFEDASRLDAVGRLAGGIAHDFNNHLTVIGGSAELLLASDDAETRELAESIVEAKLRAMLVTRQLLAFARKDVVSPRRLSLSQVLTDVQPMLRSVLGEGIDLSLHVAETPVVVADRAQVEHVLVNLMANAKDALPGGGTVTITVSPPGALVRWAAEPVHMVPEGFVEVAVRDTGPGMPEETLRRALDPFFTTRSFGERRGLGLATVHGIVTQNGGDVVLDSAPGQGTCVCLHWPLPSENVPSAG